MTGPTATSVLTRHIAAGRHPAHHGGTGGSPDRRLVLRARRWPAGGAVVEFDIVPAGAAST